MSTVDTRTGEIIEPGTSLAMLDPSEIDRAADPAAFVVLCCERAKAWLAEATTHGDIEQIVELKSQAEAIRVYTVQKQLGKDAELSAAEIVRRAERGIGVCIRKGQEAGEIGSKSHYTGGPREPYLRERNGKVELIQVLGSDVTQDLKSSSSFFNNSKERMDAYAVTDDVTDEHFETALTEAKAEKNLSRANILRKIKGEPAPAGLRPAHLRKTRHHDSNRIVNEIANGLEGYVMSLGLVTFADLDPAQVAGWSDSLTESLRSLNRLNRQLKELDQP